jgi:hypothetical protein
MDPDLVAMLTETVVHSAYVSQDQYGMPVYGSALARPARVEFRTRQMVSRTGADILSRAKIFLLPDPPVSPRDRLVLPDGTAPAIQDIWPIDDVDGTLHHIEVFF